MSSEAGGVRGSERRLEEFASRAEARGSSWWAEFYALLVENKKWWLAPIIAVLLVLALFVVLTSSAIAPFIYTLF